MLKPELLAPAGSREKLNIAFHFGADACYIGGKNFSLRSFADNFSRQEMCEAISYAHSLGKRVYVTVNIFPSNSDFAEIKDYLKFLQQANADGAIISDPGVVAACLEVAPRLPVHISTQANITNAASASFWQKVGAQRVVLARELSISEIAEIKDSCPDLSLECFVHGAMCISYSGRCLLSSYLTDRDSNRGECVQACRWKYKLSEESREDPLEIMEDERGTYIMNSKDLNMLSHLRELSLAGVDSFKIEGRMKTAYYVANVINAYRRAIDLWQGEDLQQLDILENELHKCKNRGYTTGFYFGKQNANVAYSKEQVADGYDFIAVVLGSAEDGAVKVEMRNRFKIGDVLEVLSPNADFNKEVRVCNIKNSDGAEIADAKLVQQQLFVYFSSPIKVEPLDILRRKQ